MHCVITPLSFFTHCKSGLSGIGSWYCSMPCGVWIHASSLVLLRAFYCAIVRVWNLVIFFTQIGPLKIHTAVWHWPNHRWFTNMSLTVARVSEHVNHSGVEKGFGYVEDAHDSEQMPDDESERAASWVYDGSLFSSCSHCNNCNPSGWGPVSILVLKTKTKNKTIWLDFGLIDIHKNRG